MGRVKEHYMEMEEMSLSYMANFTRFNKDNPMIFHKVVEFADKQRMKRSHYSIEIILNAVSYTHLTLPTNREV